MTIEEIKNNALENIADFVTDTAKDAFTKWLTEKILDKLINYEAATE